MRKSLYPLEAGSSVMLYAGDHPEHAFIVIESRAGDKAILKSREAHRLAEIITRLCPKPEESAR